MSIDRAFAIAAVLVLLAFVASPVAGSLLALMYGAAVVWWTQVS